MYCRYPCKTVWNDCFLNSYLCWIYAKALTLTPCCKTTHIRSSWSHLAAGQLEVSSEGQTSQLAYPWEKHIWGREREWKKIPDISQPQYFYLSPSFFSLFSFKHRERESIPLLMQSRRFTKHIFTMWELGFLDTWSFSPPSCVTKRFSLANLNFLSDAGQRSSISWIETEILKRIKIYKVETCIYFHSRESKLQVS